MKKPEHVDEFAETQVLIEAEDHASDRDSVALSRYAEYERELSRDPSSRRDAHKLR